MPRKVDRPIVIVPWDLSVECGDLADLVVHQGEDGTAEHSQMRAAEMYVLPYNLGVNSGRSAAIDVIREMALLKVVQTLTAGCDHLLGRFPPGVVLCNGKGLHDASTAEHALGLMLAQQRELGRWIRDQHARRWHPEYTGSLAGSTVVLVGYGGVGRALEARLRPCEVDIVKISRQARPGEGVSGFTALRSALKRADIVVVAVPLTAETVGIIGTEELRLLRDDALVVNVSRGRVLDVDAMLREAGRLRFAIDVTDPEPLPPAHPLWNKRGIVITPHVAGGSATFYPRARRLVVEQIRRFCGGYALLNVVS